ncbi:hypothetical protein [Halomicronema sp. CCY15110]|nr:hypothetical protein [Halomicronema sp. CCY15110]
MSTATNEGEIATDGLANVTSPGSSWRFDAEMPTVWGILKQT